MIHEGELLSEVSDIELFDGDTPLGTYSRILILKGRAYEEVFSANGFGIHERYFFVECHQIGPKQLEEIWHRYPIPVESMQAVWRTVGDDFSGR